MNFTPTPLPGVMVVSQERHQDDRGHFARTWCATEMTQHGLSANLSQCSPSFNLKRGTHRGMHYQAAPHAEAKLVRCTRGAMVDVALDLRADSPTFKQWFSLELTADNGQALYLPVGIAHGFETLCDDTDVFYMISVPYHAASSRGVRFNDPAFGIQWPDAAHAILSDRDRDLPDFAG